MIKYVALITRRPDLTPEQFKAYYENVHAKLVESLITDMVDYRRSYVDRSALWKARDAVDPDFDVIAELWFRDRKNFEEQMAVVTSERGKALLSADEDNFMDRHKMRIFVMDEVQSDKYMGGGR